VKKEKSQPNPAWSASDCDLENLALNPLFSPSAPTNKSALPKPAHSGREESSQTRLRFRPWLSNREPKLRLFSDYGGAKKKEDLPDT
jgi:hypothetical protein